MNRRTSLFTAAATAVLSLTLAVRAASPARQMEALDRGVVAVAQPDGKVFVGWRLLGTESPTLGFNVYRGNGDQAVKLNKTLLTGATNFVDEAAPRSGSPMVYTVRAVSADGTEQATSGSFTTPEGGAKPYLTIPVKTPAGYTIGDCSTADLDGDGQYDLIVHMTGRGKDNSQSGQTDPPIIQAYKLDGTMLWSINLGPNIREGAHYTQFQVADYNGDGRAELIVKTADGATDSKGKIIGDAKAKWANEQGHVQKGPEFLSVFDGLSGEVLDTIPYKPGRAGPDADGSNATPDQIKAMWGDGYGNRGDRYLAGTAYLDGVHPTAIMCRGYYTRTFLWAVDFDGKKLKERWLFDSMNPAQTKNNEITSPSSWDNSKVMHGEAGKPKFPYSGQGYHSLCVADVDGDGKDEITYGSMVINSDGTGRYSTGWGHGDAIHVGDLDPDNPGLEIFGIQERFDDAGAHMCDARTGKPLWKKPSVKAATEGGDKGEGPGRGVCFDIDPKYPGSESWAAGAGMEGLWDAKGNQIGTIKPPSCNFRIYWDGDLCDELLDKNRIDKWNPQTQKGDRLLTAEGCESINGTKATPCLSADLFGDWREEVVFRTSDNSALRIYTTTIPTEFRRFTLMHDPQYRASIAWQNTAYNQPPHVSVYMQDLAKGPPPQPNIELVKAKSATALR